MPVTVEAAELILQTRDLAARCEAAREAAHKARVAADKAEAEYRALTAELSAARSRLVDLV